MPVILYNYFSLFGCNAFTFDILCTNTVQLPCLAVLCLCFGLEFLVFYSRELFSAVFLSRPGEHVRAFVSRRGQS